MSYCIAINNLELLAQEDTLLIHYTITCTGLWYLQQLTTAYRNVCDTEWTVMYPNHQHPRHTDFPIAVTQAPYPATFAWNYGGIQGISSENFDDNHSYLVQLSIFNYDCFNTGQVNTGEPGGTGGTGQTGTGQNPTTGSPGGGPGGGGPGSPGGGNPGHPGGAFPGGGSSTGSNPGGGGGGGGGSPIPPRVAPYPTGPSGGTIPLGLPGSRPDVPGGGGGGSVDPTDPFGYKPVYPLPPEPGSEVPIGSQTEIPTFPTNNNQYFQNIPIISDRPSSQNPGSTNNPNLDFRVIKGSDANPGDRSTAPGVPTRTSSPDLNVVNSSLEGSILGQQSNNNILNRVVGEPVYNQYNIDGIEDSSTIDLIVASTDVTIGQPIVISCYFLPATEMQARLEVVIQDNTKSVPVVGTSLLNAGPSTPLTCGVATQSAVYNLGQLLVTMKVYDSLNRIIKLKSVLVTNSEQVNEGDIHSSKTTISKELPTLITNRAGLNTYGHSFDLIGNQSAYLIYTSDVSQTNVSAVLKVSDSSKDLYTLAVYSPTTLGGRDLNEVFSSSQIAPQSIAYSDKRFMLNGQEVMPETHSVAITNSTIPSATTLIIEVAPKVNNIESTTQGSLYLSKAFNLREISGSYNSNTLVVDLPMAGEKYGLILHGPISGEVPTDYSDRIVTTSTLGKATWNNVSLNAGDYYSIVQAYNGVVNPFRTAIYTTRYQS